MPATTGLSGNEIFCLEKKGYKPGNILVGNSVHSMGFLGSVRSGFKIIFGGEIVQMTQLIVEGRETAYKRMLQEAQTQDATGITGVTSELIFHGSNIEFLSIGSAVHAADKEKTPKFSSSADGQEIYAQLDAGYQPICFAFGNTAYSIGVGRGMLGGIKTLARGEIKEYSDIFNHTRHLSLIRIMANARQYGANAVLGIRTSIIPLGGYQEMLMIGTASHTNQLTLSEDDVTITSDMTNIEMWNMANLGYAPQRLLLGTSVYSLGVMGGIIATLKSFVRGEINELTRMVYDARENALGIIDDEAKAIGADDVVGVKTYVYQLGNGLIEFLAIGTAVKKIDGVKTESSELPAQAIIVDKDTFFDSNVASQTHVDVNRGAKPIIQGLLLPIMIVVIYVLFWLYMHFIH